MTGRPGAERLRCLPAAGPPTAESDPDANRPGAAGAEPHPMQRVTRQIAFEPGGWTPERAAKIATLFDGMADEWSRRDSADRAGAVLDALQRAEVHGSRCLELGSGTGATTSVLAERFDVVMAVDLSVEMLRRAPDAAGTRVWADASRLPVPAGSIDVAVLVNMFLFPEELRRVLRPTGTVVWVSSAGHRTPIHLEAADVLDALGPAWHGVAGQWGAATWCVARR